MTDITLTSDPNELQSELENAYRLLDEAEMVIVQAAINMLHRIGLSGADAEQIFMSKNL